MTAAASAHVVLREAEDDVRSVPELLRAIETIASLAHSSGQGLEPDECFAVFRLAITIGQIAQRVETMWEQAFEASSSRGGRP